MNNLITSNAPWSVTIKGRSFDFDADYRNFIKFEQLMRDVDITDEMVRYQYIVNLFFIEIPPLEDAKEVLDAVLEMYKGGSLKYNEEPASSTRIYDFVEDAELIYSAFRSDYNIDLTEIEQLHWWKFKALFMGIKPENTISKIMEYRGMDTSKFKGEQKAFYDKMKKRYALGKDKRTEDLMRQIADRLKRGESINDLVNR